ncbi:MAG: CPBP family intramembrane glutamic endopeptidase [Roseiflexus sp.]
MERIMSGSASLTAAQSSSHTRLMSGLTLAGLVWIVGLVGHFTPLGEWPALFLYVLGSIGVALMLGVRYGLWDAMWISRRGLKRALAWGGGIGLALLVIDNINTYMYYRSGGAPMAQMEEILIGMRLVFFFPLLVLAEEFLWRGILLSGLHDAEINRHLAVLLTTAAYALNHFAVAPVGMVERAMMAAMGLPIGIAGGYLALKTRNVWAAVTLHGLTMISMIVDIFVIPRLV